MNWHILEQINYILQKVKREFVLEDLSALLGHPQLMTNSHMIFEKDDYLYKISWTTGKGKVTYEPVNKTTS